LQLALLIIDGMLAFDRLIMMLGWGNVPSRPTQAKLLDKSV